MPSIRLKALVTPTSHAAVTGQAIHPSDQVNPSSEIRSISRPEDITAAVHDGALPVGEDAGLPLTWFPLEQTPAAHDAVEQGTVGKVLVRVSQD